MNSDVVVLNEVTGPLLTYILLLSGAEKEAKKTSFVHSLAQRTNQETSTPYQTTPYMGCLKRKVAARRRLFGLLGIAGHAMSVYRLAHRERA